MEPQPRNGAGRRALVTPERLRELAEARDPARAASFTGEEWRDAAFRVDQLARLLWEVAGRRADGGADGGSER